MAQYGIGLSALNAFSEAIDVTSNNIANGQTVGYKSAEYVFADQFFKAQNPQSRDRAGMGTSRMIIRRANTYGTLSGTQNPLDLAIAGPGMFILAKQVDGTTPTENPQKFQYTRNGQFAVDANKRIVNENGLFLVGYAADSKGNIITNTKSTLKLDDEPLSQVPTRESTININIDNRADALSGRLFDPLDPASYSQSTSQTVYDSLGKSHILSLYYKKVNSSDLTLEDLTSTGTKFTFDVKQSLGTTQNGEQTDKIATTAVPSTVTGSTQTLNNAKLTYLSGGLEGGNGIKTLSGFPLGAGLKDGIYKDVALAAGGGSGAKATFTVFGGQVTSGVITETGSGYTNPGSAPTAVVDGATITLGVTAFTTANTGEGKLGSIYDLKLSDGTILTVKKSNFSTDNATKSTYIVQADRYAVFATIDGIPVGSDITGTGKTSVKLSGVPNSEQTSLGTMAFVAGKNLDSLSRDAYDKPQFNTKLTITAGPSMGNTWGKTANGGTIGFTLSSTDTTGYSSFAQTYTNTQDGSPTAQLTAYSFDSYGKLVAQYDNGKSIVKGQLILATFNNFEGLVPVGGNGFQASAVSGDPLEDTPNGSQMGAIRAQAVEESNVDLTQQLVKLMVLQRAYSAASQATKVQVATLVDDTLRIGQ